MSGNAFFRFYSELNDFLTSEKRFAVFSHAIAVPASVKDVIEALGVPHPEVGLILVNSTPVEFSHLARGGDHVSVYPEFRNFDTSTIPRLRPPLPNMRFVLDAHLGRLARNLRMLGFDSSYQTNCDDEELARISHDEPRILLTRDSGLLKRSVVVYGYFVRETDPKLQIVEVVKRFNLSASASPFSRCLACNALLRAVPKDSLLEWLEPKTREHYTDFQVCSKCHRIYWAGSHYEHMQEFVKQVLG
jgi:uncharacterized protein with PIN domain